MRLVVAWSRVAAFEDMALETGCRELPAVLVGGVSLAGKSSMAEALAKVAGQKGLFSDAGENLVEGDDLHSVESIEKMRFGTPLREADRRVWRARIAEKIRTRPTDRLRIITCSALRRESREELRRAGMVCFILLALSRKSAEHRAMIRLREAWETFHRAPGKPIHYFQPAIYPELLDGQFEDFELPSPEERDCLLIDIDELEKGVGTNANPGGRVEYVTLAPGVIAWILANSRMESGVTPVSPHELPKLLRPC